MKDGCAAWFGRALSYCCESGDVSTASLIRRLAWEISHGVAGDLDSVAVIFSDSAGTCTVGHQKEGDTLPSEVLQGFLIEQEKEPLSCRVRDHALDSLRFFGRQLRTSITVRLQHCNSLEPDGEAIVWFGTSGVATPKRIQVAQDVSQSLSEWFDVYAGVIKSYRGQAFEIGALQASKREMITIAHDVRAPLSTLQYLISEMGEEEHYFIAEKNQICQELRYVDGLLEGLSPRHQDRALGSSDVATVLSVVLARVVERFAPEAKRRGASIRCLVQDESSLRISTNELALERILSNVIGNAVRYGGAGAVHINSIAGDAGFCSLEILDEGEGFPLDVLNALREGGCVADQIKQADGWGIGLRATQRLLRQYGGEICVSNTAMGGRVLLRLPLSGRYRTSISNAADECRSKYTAPCDRTAMVEPSGIELVIVDDDREHATSLERIVSKKGATARVFITVRDALTYLENSRNSRRACVICDVHMPDGGANTLLNKLQESSYGISCAVMSGEAPDEELYQFAALGAREFFSKPIDVSVLLAWIEYEEGGQRVVGV